MVGKSFPRKHVPTKNFHQKFVGRKFFLLLQNNFLKNRFLKNFHQKYFGRIVLMVAKSFPQKQFPN
jgi:hypothetical protein